MSELNVVGLVKAVQQFERNVSTALMYSGLRIPQFRLLDSLDEIGEATVTEMSKRLGITRASASVMINELIRSGLLVVNENESDRRSFQIHISEHGRSKLNVGRKDLSVLRKELSSSLPDEMVEALNEFAGYYQPKR
ncbi:hypothetical protein BOW53_13085 [Solemya pervernicosa gill symbiont]|uniref:HTH marR-type domain-containing protein n=2 Tax=Gammaproteobacteria incertae sedis TaxID=118884 RepID=A0A1T2L1R9_9GAMM|nr:MarR family transcriptional regulator [Candidatus Reidiella endopervernicosa]OOZ39063.1 hypothetical protein BOW53_13085 [Solemya pervernicosa gill symbiont]QKQ25170.1 MarR family transcriptional regulator [Candidatus Reidiella endopervernicosa]